MCQNTLRLFYQSAFRHEQPEDAFSQGFQWEGLVIVFRSDLLAKRDCTRVGLGLVKFRKSGRLIVTFDKISMPFLSSLAYLAEFLEWREIAVKLVQ